MAHGDMVLAGGRPFEAPYVTVPIFMRIARMVNVGALVLETEAARGDLNAASTPS